MDNDQFARRNIENELFDYEREPELPLTSWYRPTRDEMLDGTTAAAPHLMSAQEETISTQAEDADQKVRGAWSRI